MTAPNGASTPERTEYRRSFPVPNNFDLLRLLAALQVVYFHATYHLKLHMGALRNPLNHVLAPFSGVPIFFVISGFLVSASFERRRDHAVYARNRALRIFPALWVCFAVTLLLLAVTGFLGTVLGTTRFGVWSVAQLTFGQFVKLPAFGGFGVGVPNGSLWTIPVELGFYVAIPILYLLIIDRTTKRTGNLLVGALLTVSLLSAIALAQVDPNQTQLSAKLFYQTPIPHLYLFLLGVLAQRNYGSVSRWVEGKFLWWTGICLVLGIWAVSEPASLPQQGLFVLARLSLAAWVLAFAFSRPTVSDKLLRRNDPSYGTYLYHMLIVNMLVEAGIVGNAWLLPAVMIGAAAVGLLSWKAVEQPMLRLKATRRPAPATPALASPESSAA